MPVYGGFKCSVPLFSRIYLIRVNILLQVNFHCVVMFDYSIPKCLDRWSISESSRHLASISGKGHVHDSSVEFT